MHRLDYIPEWRKKGISTAVSINPFAFFRIDDVGYEDTLFLKLSDYLNLRGVAYSVAVIPDKISALDSNVEKAIHLKSVYPLQHGFSHSINYNDGFGNYGEFHIALPIHENKDKLIRGWTLFADLIGNRLKGFIPPWHSFPQIELLIQNKYNIISGYGDRIESIAESLLSIPANLDIVSSYITKESFTLELLLAQCDTLLHEQGFLGILLHHNIMPTDYDSTIGPIIDHLSKRRVPIISLESLGEIL